MEVTVTVDPNAAWLLFLEKGGIYMFMVTQRLYENYEDKMSSH